MIICQVSTAMPENMAHESHFRAMFSTQDLHHNLVLEDMRVKQVKTVSTRYIQHCYIQLLLVLFVGL